MTASSLPSPPPASLAQLGRELHGVCASATQPEEIAAALEAHGLNDDLARARYGLPSTFACAEALFHLLPYRQPPPPALPAAAPMWALAPRGVLYALPGAALAVAGPLLEQLPGARPALVVSVVFGWGWGQGMAHIGYRRAGHALGRFLRGAVWLSVPAAAVVAGAVALFAGPGADGLAAPGQLLATAASVGALAGASFAAFAGLLILGRLLLAALAYLPCLALLLAGGPGADPLGAGVAVACAALLPLVALVGAPTPPGGLQLPTPPWGQTLAYAASGWACAVFVTVVFGAGGPGRPGAEALLPVIVSVGAMEVLALGFQYRLRGLARRHGSLGGLALAALRRVLGSLGLYLLVLTVLLGAYLGVSAGSPWAGGWTVVLPLTLYGCALLLGAVVGNAGRPWVACAAWLLGGLVFGAAQVAGLQGAPLLGTLTVLAHLAMGVMTVLLLAITYR